MNRAAPTHFRAHERKPVRLGVGLSAPRLGERSATVVDVSLAGAGLETDELLIPGERISVSFQTPTLWDPLVLSAVVTWSAPPTPRDQGAASTAFRNRAIVLRARAGVCFDYASPDVVLAMFEMLATLDYE